MGSFDKAQRVVASLLGGYIERMAVGEPEATTKLCDYIAVCDPEFFALVAAVMRHNTSGHVGGGQTIKDGSVH